MPSTPPGGPPALVLQKIAPLPGRTGCDPIYVKEYGLLIVLCSNEHEIAGVAGAQYNEYIRAYDLTATPGKAINLHGTNVSELPLLWYILSPVSQPFQSMLYSEGKLYCAVEEGIYQLDVQVGESQGLIRGVESWTYLDLGEPVFPPLEHRTNLFVLSRKGKISKIGKLHGDIIASRSWASGLDIQVPPVLLDDKLLFVAGWNLHAVDLANLQPAWETEIRDTSLTGAGGQDIFEGIFDAKNKLNRPLPKQPILGLTVVDQCAVVTFFLWWTDKALEFMLKMAPLAPNLPGVWAKGATAEMFSAFMVNEGGGGKMFPIATVAGDLNSLPGGRQFEPAPEVAITLLSKPVSLDHGRYVIFHRSRFACSYRPPPTSPNPWTNPGWVDAKPCLISKGTGGDLTVSEVKFADDDDTSFPAIGTEKSVRWEFTENGLVRQSYSFSNGLTCRDGGQYSISKLVGDQTSPVAIDSVSLAFAARWHRDDDFQMEDWLVTGSV